MFVSNKNEVVKEVQRTVCSATAGIRRVPTERCGRLEPNTRSDSIVSLEGVNGCNEIAPALQLRPQSLKVRYQPSALVLPLASGGELMRQPLLTMPMSLHNYGPMRLRTMTSASSSLGTDASNECQNPLHLLLKNQHQFKGVCGILLSGLGALLSYSCIVSRSQSVDEDDSEEVVDTHYNLNYQLNNKSFDAALDNNHSLSAYQGNHQAFSEYLFSNNPSYNAARDELLKYSKIPLPDPKTYGLFGYGLEKNNALSIENNLSSGALKEKYPFKGKTPIVNLSPPPVLPGSLLAFMPKGIFMAALDYSAFASVLIEKYGAYHTHCKRVYRANFERELSSQVVAYQHQCFLKNIPWHEAMPIAKLEIAKRLLKTDPYAIKNPMLAAAAMDSRLKRVSYSVHAEGGRFKSHKKTAFPLARHTQIRSANGRVYALLNSLSQTDSQVLFDQFGLSKSGRFILGEGNFGRVRLAQDVRTGKIVAVKKMFSRHLANLEIAQYSGIPPNDHLVSLYDYAHVRTSDGDNKSFLFMELVGDVNGDALVQALAARRHKGARNKEHKLLTQAVLECTVAVVKLHELGIYHCDIKPENFFISHRTIHLGDYGLATRDKSKHLGSTLAYNPFDQTYDAEKHDAYSLGITFYEFMHAAHPKELGESPKTANTNTLPGDSLNECIAKLRDEDPNKRITVREFIQLPYIQKLMSRKQKSAVRDLILTTKSNVAN